VAARARPDKPLLIADYGGGYISLLAGDGVEIAEKLAGALELELVDPPRPPSRMENSGGAVRRRMEGAVPGEKITVNGIVVGTALQETVEISTEGGKILDIRGAEVKLHGIEKLSSLDLETAILRTGEIRRTRNVPRSVSNRGVDAVLIDHAAEEAFEKADGHRRRSPIEGRNSHSRRRRWRFRPSLRKDGGAKRERGDSGLCRI